MSIQNCGCFSSQYQLNSGITINIPNNNKFSKLNLTICHFYSTDRSIQRGGYGLGPSLISYYLLNKLVNSFFCSLLGWDLGREQE